MGVLAFSLFKQHVRADEFTDDDAYLSHLLNTAEACVIASTNRSLPELVQMGGGEFPKPLVHAIMMLGAHWYSEREAVSVAQLAEVPYTLQSLIKPYRKLSSE